MTALKNILVATDLSTASRLAAERAAQLASASGARMRLVHTLSGNALNQLEQLLGQDTRVEKALVDQAGQTLEALAAELGSLHSMAVQSKLLKGAVHEEIAAQAEAWPADIVVVGARGAGFMRGHLFGSTAERLLRKSAHPMLVVKQPAQGPYRRVLVPLDLSEWSYPMIELALRVAPGAHLVLMNAYEVPFEGKMRFANVADTTIEGYRTKAQRSASLQLHELAARAGLKPADWTPFILPADPSLAIVKQEHELKCDLIVIGKRGQNLAEDLLLGSVTKHVLTKSEGDVLVSALKNPG